ncbi:wax ester/triacylglycerol synthase domain-containing protein [Cryobacterium zhongshanensis]|uniref:diacylglycerol O-acyltransferase n=1 Tax=Cryobacterium zhongshanensis TaxID=2928153 RepID=A0AA41QTY3_9MICO|nr:wax ester/triacylglycerol synthase domain-containing protein [Cryobacterium zhongshanensis]MCI4656938.1 WS/DGAT domain-containing protein [Cryobacterium zhongshanensis]
MPTLSPIDRVSVDDLMSLATERGSAPMQVGAVLFLDSRAGLDTEAALGVLAERIRRVPRLRQRLVDVPIGCGRPAWVDDPAFDVANHLSSRVCPAPGGEAAVFDVTAGLLGARLPRSRPLWTAVLLTGVGAGAAGTSSDDRAALIIVFHHVLADGMGGLAVMSHLVDRPEESSPLSREGAGAADRGFPRPMPSVGALARDAWARRVRAAQRLPATLARAAGGLLALRGSIGAPRLARTSLNVPTGPRRRFVSIRLDLAEVLAAGHAHHATVNDVVLTAIGGALHRLLEQRGEQQESFILSVPFSGRRQASVGELGNQSGAIPIRAPGVGHLFTRLDAVAAATRTAKLAPAGASTALLGPFFRLLARLGLFQRFISRQRTIHTFVTNLRGPGEPLAIFGCPVTGIVPLTGPTGNVTVSFAVLSYAGGLEVTLAADPDACPDLPALRTLLEHEFATLLHCV